MLIITSRIKVTQTILKTVFLFIRFHDNKTQEK